MTVIEAPELMTKVGILASVTSGAIASDVGVIPMPRRPTFSLTIISLTMRRAVSATPPSSRTMISIFARLRCRRAAGHKA